MAHTRTGGERLREFVVALIVGFVYTVASVPTFIEYLIRSRGWSWLSVPARWTSDLNHALPPFAILERAILYVFAAYAFVLLVLCLRHGRPRLAAGALGTLALSVAVLHVLAWIGSIAFYVIRFVFTVLGFVVRFLDVVARHVIQFLVFVFDPASGPWAWVALAIVAAVVVLVMSKFGLKGMLNVLVLAAAIAIPLAVVRGIAALLGLIAPWLRGIGDVLQIVFVTAVVLVAVATIGQLLIDQFRSTAKAGSEKLGVLMGAMGVGTVLATLLLESGAFHNYDLYPESVHRWAEKWMLSGGGGPLLDAGIALFVVGLCVLFVLGNLAKMKEPPDLEEFQRSIVYIFLGFVAAGMLSAIGSDAQNT